MTVSAYQQLFQTHALIFWPQASKHFFVSSPLQLSTQTALFSSHRRQAPSSRAMTNPPRPKSAWANSQEASIIDTEIINRNISLSHFIAPTH